jgi:serine/threonine protein kinase
MVISEAAPAPEPPSPTIPGYEILGVIGRGGMGVVYKARHLRLKRLTALKIILRDRLSANSDAIQRFQREALAAAQLFHPNIVVVFDSDHVGDTYFIAMEYVDGTDLHQLVKDHGPLPIEQACEFVRQAALGLQHALECGMVHRDIKPSNLLVSIPRKGVTGAELPIAEALADPKIWKQAVVKILDMGLALMVHAPDSPSAQWTQAGVLMGTPDFIAPEQALDSHNVDIRADLYSLGCSFYYLLTGAAPFGDCSLMKKLMMHQSGEPKPVEELRTEVPTGLARIVRKMMAKNVDERFQTPAELIEALGRLMGTTVAPPPPVPAPVPIPIPRPAVDAEKNQSTFLAPVSPPKAKFPAPKTPVPRSSTSDSTFSTRPCPTTQEPELPPGLSKATRIAALESGRGWVTALAFSSDRATLISGGVEGRIRLSNMTGETDKDRTLHGAHPSDIAAVAVAPDNRRFASASGSLKGTALLWEYDRPEPRPIAILPTPDFAIDVLAFAPHCRLLAGAGTDMHIHLWDTSTKIPVAKCVLKGHRNTIRALTFASDNETIASAGVDGTVRVWAPSRFWSKELAVLQGDWDQVRTLSFAPGSSNTIAFGGMDQTVRIFDLSASSPRELHVLRGHLGIVRLVHFNRDKQTLISMCDGGRLIKWNAASGEKVKEWVLPRGKIFNSVAITHDGRYLAGGDSEGVISLFRLYPRNEGE